MQDIDTSNGVIFPFYDPDTNMVYLCGKVCFMEKINLYILFKQAWSNVPRIIKNFFALVYEINFCKLKSENGFDSYNLSSFKRK